MAFVTRFAPQPTGPLHLGHAYSAMLAHDMARAEGRPVPSADRGYRPSAASRSGSGDLSTTCIGWASSGTPNQCASRTRLPRYHQALEALWQMGLTYPCTCTRGDISPRCPRRKKARGRAGRVRSIPAPAAAMALEPAGPRRCHPAGQSAAGSADAAMPGRSSFDNRPGYAGLHRIDPDRNGCSADLVTAIGDIVLARRDMGTSYHLSVVVRRCRSGHHPCDPGRGPVRGDEDSRDAAAPPRPAHPNLPPPPPDPRRSGQAAGQARRCPRLSKYRAEGATPADIRRMVGLPNP
jgi:glutamyl-Q tRNA(Asp) synthetase